MESVCLGKNGLMYFSRVDWFHFIIAFVRVEKRVRVCGYHPRGSFTMCEVTEEGFNMENSIAHSTLYVNQPADQC